MKKTIYLLIFSLGFSLFNFLFDFEKNYALASSQINSSYLQVKTLHSPKVYYLDHKLGVKKAYVNQTSYLSYGNKWEDVKIVREEDLNKWPDLKLVKTANNSAVFYIENSQKTLIKTEEDFVQYGFSWNKIAIINDLDLAQYKDVSNQALALKKNFPRPEINNINKNNDKNLKIKKDNISIKNYGLRVGKNVFSEKKGIIMASFEIRSINNEISIDSLDFVLEKNSTAPDLKSSFCLVNYESGEIYNCFEGSRFVRGLVRVDLNNLKLEKNKKLIVSLVTEKITEETKNGDNYQIVLNKLNYRNNNNTYFSELVNVWGDKINVNKAKVFVYPNNLEKAPTFTNGQKNIKIASFLVEVGAGQDAVLESLTINRGDFDKAVSFANGFSNLQVRIGGRKSEIIKQPSGSTYEFSNLNYTVRGGQRIEVAVYADTETDLGVEETRLMLLGMVFKDRQSLFKNVINNLNIYSQKVYFKPLKVEARILAGGSFVANYSNNKVVVFEVKNNSGEDVRLKSIRVNTDEAGFSSSVGFTDLRIVVLENRERRLGSVGRPVSGANTVSLSNYIIKAGDQKTFAIYVKTNSQVTRKDILTYLDNLEIYGINSRISAKAVGFPSSEERVYSY